MGGALCNTGELLPHTIRFAKLTCAFPGVIFLLSSACCFVRKTCSSSPLISLLSCNGYIWQVKKIFNMLTQVISLYLRLKLWSNIIWSFYYNYDFHHSFLQLTNFSRLKKVWNLWTRFKGKAAISREKLSSKWKTKKSW